MMLSSKQHIAIAINDQLWIITAHGVKVWLVPSRYYPMLKCSIDPILKHRRIKECQSSSVSRLLHILLWKFENTTCFWIKEMPYNWILNFPYIIRTKDIKLYEAEYLSQRELWIYNANVRNMAQGLCKCSDEKIIMESFIKGLVLLTSS